MTRRNTILSRVRRKSKRHASPGELLQLSATVFEHGGYSIFKACSDEGGIECNAARSPGMDLVTRAKC